MSTRKSCWVGKSALIIMAATFSFCSIGAITRYTHLQINPYIYSISFSTLLLLSYTVLEKKLLKTKLVKTAAIGTIIGYICGTLSFFIDVIFSPYGIEKMVNDVSNFGFFNLTSLALNALPGLVTGGWIIGLILFILMPTVRRKSTALTIRHTREL